MDKLQRLRQGSMSAEKYRQQMELLLSRARPREEERISIAKFLSGLNMEVRDMVKFLPYRDLDELVQLCIKVEQQHKKKSLLQNLMAFTLTQGKTKPKEF